MLKYKDNNAFALSFDLEPTVYSTSAFELAVTGNDRWPCIHTYFSVLINYAHIILYT